MSNNKSLTPILNKSKFGFFKGIGATLNLLNTYFWRTIYGPILAFLVPQLVLAILGNVMRVQYVFPGIISLSIMLVGVLALPLGMMELKNSTLLKFIGTTRVSKGKFVVSAVLYYVVIIFISIFLSVLMGMAFFSKEIFLDSKLGGFGAGLYSGLFSTIGFFNFLFAVILSMILSIGIGMGIASFSKTPQQALTFSLIIVFISMFISGMIVSVDIIASSDVMQWVSRFNPFRYTTGNLVVASTPLPQTLEFLDSLSPAEMKLIFNEQFFKMGTDGSYQIVRPDGMYDEVYSTSDLLKTELYNQFKIFMSHWPKALQEVLESKAAIINLDVANYLHLNPNQLSSADTQTIKEFLNINSQSFWDFMNDSTSRYNQIFGSKFSEVWTQLQIDLNKEGIDFKKLTYYLGSDSSIGVIKSRTLFKSLFVDSPVIWVSGTSNSVFDWNHNWGVRRIPTVEAVKEFTTSFLTGDELIADSFNADPNNIIDLGSDVSRGDFQFMDLFVKQTSQLYTIPDKVLNVFLPITLSAGLFVYASKRFRWSAR